MNPFDSDSPREPRVSSPRSSAKNFQSEHENGRAGTPESQNHPESSAYSTEDEGSHFANSSLRRNSQQSTPNFSTSKSEQFDFESESKSNQNSPSSSDKLERTTSIKPASHAISQRRLSACSKTASASQMYRKPPLKPNIRPNLGMNDRPRIYNPFPVNYVHNSKLKKGKALGMYPAAKSSDSGVGEKEKSGSGSGTGKSGSQVWK